MSVIINIVLILVSLVLIVAVLMQEGNKQGLGAIGGAAETFLGKNKAKGFEGKLLLITKVTAAVFVVISVLATWMNARTWTVKYYVDGVEYFPAHEASIESVAFSQAFGFMKEEQANEQLEALSKLSDEEKRASYGKGQEIIAYEVPVKEGYNGEWDKELPTEMDKKNYVLNAVYTIGQYTLTFEDGHYEGDTDATSEEAHEHATLGDPITKLYKATISEAEIPELPVVEGYTSTWSEAIPTHMPGVDKTITVVYTKIVEEDTLTEATSSEALASEGEAVVDTSVVVATTPEATNEEATSSEATTGEAA